MKKLNKILIFLLVVLVLLASTCFGYDQHLADGTVFFSVNDPFLGYAQNFPEYSDYLQANYEIILLWDSWADHTCYMYFVEPSTTKYITLTGRYNNCEFSFDGLKWVRYKRYR